MDLGGGVVCEGSADILCEGNKGGESREGRLTWGTGGAVMNCEGQAGGLGWLTAVRGGRRGRNTEGGGLQG